jgi:hypothetical protein
MNKYRKLILTALIILNLLVLLGQIWPEGAPPFARTVNVATLMLNLFYFAGRFRKNNG